MSESEAIEILLQILYDEKIGEKGTYFDGLPCEGTMIKINEAISIVRGKE